MQSKPQVAAFINFYLTNVNEIITEVGYFPASGAALTPPSRPGLMQFPVKLLLLPCRLAP
jgi:hypothetical protein